MLATTSQVDVVLRRTTASATVAVALCAAVLSYTGLHDLAVSAGISQAFAALVPLCVDGLIVVGALTVLGATLSDGSATYGWLLTMTGVCLSVYGNAASADTLRGGIVHAIAPISLALCIEGMMLSLRRRTLDIRAVEEAARRDAKRLEILAQRPKRKPSRPRTARTSSPLVEVDEATLAQAHRLKADGKSYAQIADELPHRSRAAWHRLLKDVPVEA